MSTLAQCYGITNKRNIDGQPFSEVHISKPYLNWYGNVYGGCFMLLASDSAQNSVAAGLYGSNFHFRFLRGACFGETMIAHTDIMKSGRTSVATTTAIRSDNVLVGDVQADFLHVSERVPFFNSEILSSLPEPQPCDFILNAKDNPSQFEDGQAFQQMFCAISWKKFALEKSLGGRVSVGLYTDQNFTDCNGFIDPALFGILIDDAAGLACWSIAGPCVTTSITMSLLSRIKPGAFVSCQAEVAIKTGVLMLVQGTLWADNALLGACMSTFLQTVVS
jgi:acyl-coenzyme A thioesterase PaaI-like protein